MSAGLSLRTGISAGISAPGTYTPMNPGSASPSTAGSIGSKAYGISATGYDWKPTTAAIGSVSVGVVAIIALVYLWWSLPR